MDSALTSTTGLVPLSFSLIGVLVALQYLKGMADFAKAIKFIFFGFAFVLLAKLSVFLSGSVPEGYFYFLSLLFHLLSAVFLTAGGCGIRGIKFFSKPVVGVFCLLSFVWSWYIVLVMGDGNTLTVSLALSNIGYGVLAASLWRKKVLRDSIGFVITGWFCIFLILYNLLSLMAWGQSLLSPAFETFLYIAVMCGFILISNNLMAHQFDTLAQEADESKERLRLMIQMSPFPIIISRLKDDQLMLINNKAGALFGLDVKHPGNFKTIDYFAEPAKRTELLAKLEKHPVVDDFEFLVKPRKGEPFWLLLSARVIDFEYEIALYMAFQDITDRKKKELQLFDQATKDPLTKCYNRRQFDELAKNEVLRARRYGHPFCLFMIDADHFKNVNDTHGHAVGDLVLMALADCCRRTLRESDIIARFGGEEFVILLPEVSLENAHRVTERLRIKISKLVVKNEQNQNVQFTVSIGLVSSTVTDDITAMLKLSDDCLYVAKENGRNRVVVYEENGPNKDRPVPTSDEIEAAKTEPLFYFKPSSMPVIKQHTNESVETGVVGLSGAAASEHEEDLLDDEEELETRESEQHGVSLSALYDDDDDNTAPTIALKPAVSAPPVPPPSEVFTSAADEEYEMELPSEADVEPSLEDEPALPEEEELPPEEPEPQIETIEDEPVVADEVDNVIDEEPQEFVDELVTENAEAEVEPELPQQDRQEPEVYDDDLPLEEEVVPAPEESAPIVEDESVEPELPAIEEEEPELQPESEDAQAFAVPPPPSLEDFEAEPPLEDDLDAPLLGDDSDENGFMPPPLSLTTEPVPPPPVPAPVPVAQPVPVPSPHPAQKVMMKKIPIKMPSGMVKIPKMPGVVKMKIPKTLQQPTAPNPPKPQD